MFNGAQAENGRTNIGNLQKRDLMKRVHDMADTTITRGVRDFQLMPETQIATDEGIGHDLTAFQQNLLAVLSEEPMYGLAIKRQLDSYYDSEINHGRLYPNLDRLVELGFVEKSELDKRTNQYALTDAGHEVIIDTLGWIISKFVTDDDRAQTVEDLVDRQQ